MRTVLAVLALVLALSSAGCLRTTYNHCTEMPPDRECEALDSGLDGGPDAGPDAAPPTDGGEGADAAATPDAGTDAR